VGASLERCQLDDRTAVFGVAAVRFCSSKPQTNTDQKVRDYTGLLLSLARTGSVQIDLAATLLQRRRRAFERSNPPSRQTGFRLFSQHF